MNYQSFEKIWSFICRYRTPSSSTIFRKNILMKEVTIKTKWTRICPIRKREASYITNHIYSLTNNCAYQNNDIPIEVSTIELYKSIGEITIKIIEFEEDKNKKYVLEKWKNNSLIVSINLTNPDFFDNIYMQGDFSSLVFSKDADKVYFIAERSTKNKVQDNNENFVYKENFGEKLTKISHPCIFQYDLKNNEISKLLDEMDKLYPFKLFLSSDEKLIFLALEKIDFIHGWRINTNQSCGIFQYHPVNRYEKITPDNKCVYSACIHPNKDLLIYLQRSIGGPHLTSVDVFILNIETKKSTNLIKDVFCLTLFDDCWVECDENNMGIILNILDGKKGKDSMLYVYQTFDSWKSVLIQTPDKDEFSETCITIYNPRRDEITDQFPIVVYSRSNYFRPNDLALFQLNPGNIPQFSEVFPVQPIILYDQSESIENPIKGTINHYLFDKNRKMSISDCSFGGIVCKPKIIENKEVSTFSGLIVLPHGGPHSLSTKQFRILTHILLLQNFVIYFPNYNGSLGFDASTTDRLLGKIGDMDVMDVQNSTIEICQKESLSIDNVHFIGGSHGGFLGAHLIGQYSNFYKSCCLLNPVIDLLSMYATSDIPEWVFVEAGIDYTNWKHLSVENLEKLYKASPIYYANNIKTPVLLILGEDDKRVPSSSQGMLLFKMMQSNKANIKLLTYPNEGHALDGANTSMNVAFKILNFILEHNIAKGN